MVRSLIRGDKTETRRIGAKPWKADDRLWVREFHWSWGQWNQSGERKDGRTSYRFQHHGRRVIYDNPFHYGPMADFGQGIGWAYHPGIHMPRWASRLTLLVHEVRSEPLHDITESGAVAEGIGPMGQGGFGVHGDTTIWEATAVKAYAALWDVINGAGAWTANPLVTVTRFEVHQRNIDKLDKAA